MPTYFTLGADAELLFYQAELNYALTTGRRTRLTLHPVDYPSPMHTMPLSSAATGAAIHSIATASFATTAATAAFSAPTTSTAASTGAAVPTSGPQQHLETATSSSRYDDRPLLAAEQRLLVELKQRAPFVAASDLAIWAFASLHSTGVVNERSVACINGVLGNLCTAAQLRHRRTLLPTGHIHGLYTLVRRKGAQAWHYQVTYRCSPRPPPPSFPSPLPLPLTTSL